MLDKVGTECTQYNLMKRRYDMQSIRVSLRKMGAAKIGLIILALGIFIGFLFANIFKGFYWNQIDILDSSYFSKIRTAEIDYTILFQYVMWKNFKIFLLFWIFTATAVGIPYMVLSVWYAGFEAGFFIAVILMRYGIKGILLIFGYTFPHYLIYIPVAIFCLSIGYHLCRNMYYEVKINRRGKVERIFKHIMTIIILAGALTIGSFLETYAGSYILKKILTLF